MSSQNNNTKAAEYNTSIYSIDILKLSQFFLCLAMFFFHVFGGFLGRPWTLRSAVVFGRQSRWVLSSLPRRSGAEVTKVIGYNYNDLSRGHLVV